MSFTPDQRRAFERSALTLLEPQNRHQFAAGCKKLLVLLNGVLSPPDRLAFKEALDEDGRFDAEALKDHRKRLADLRIKSDLKDMLHALPEESAGMARSIASTLKPLSEKQVAWAERTLRDRNWTRGAANEKDFEVTE